MGKKVSNIYSLVHLNQVITAEPEKWRPLVFTNGCFDLLHVGHIRYLKEARSLGKALIVGVNSDYSVQQIKPSSQGLPQRPIIPEEQRLEVLASLKCVDGVVLFAETTANQVIATLQPDIYVKGGDYSIETLPEAPTVQNYGGKIQLVQIEIPTSTSRIIQKILSTCL